MDQFYAALWTYFAPPTNCPMCEFTTSATPFASPALAIGEPLPVIGKLLGHSDIETTASYPHLAHASIHETAERIAESTAADIL